MGRWRQVPGGWAGSRALNLLRFGSTEAVLISRSSLLCCKEGGDGGRRRPMPLAGGCGDNEEEICRCRVHL